MRSVAHWPSSKATLCSSREPRARLKRSSEEAPLVGDAREQVSGGEHPQDVIARRPQPVSGETVCPHPVRARSAPQDHGPGRDSLDPEPLEVADPVVERRCVRRRVVPDLVAKPVAGVRERIVRAVVEEPRIAAAPVDPLAQRRRPVLAGRDDPADEHLREGALLERCRSAANDVARDGVTGKATVAEQVRRLRRDHERWVAAHEPEATSLDRLKEAAAAELDVLDSVQPRVECREGDCPRVDVGRDDTLAVASRKDRLDARSGPNVERRLDRSAHRQVRRAGSEGPCTPAT